jgi:hypothetical protein
MSTPTDPKKLLARSHLASEGACGITDEPHAPARPKVG